MAVKKKTPAPLSSFDDLDSAGIGIGYQPMSFADEPAVVAAPEKQTLARRVGDTAVQFGQGAVTGVKMMSDVFGANNAVSSGLGDVNQALDGLLSATAQNDKQKVAQIMQEAEGKGWGEQIVAGLKAAGVDPVGLAANALGTSLPTMATMLIPGAGPAAVATRMGAGVAMGAGQGVGAVKGQIYDETKRKWLEARATPEQAEAKAQEAAAYGGENTDQIAIGGVLGMGSVLGAERALGKVLHGAGKAGPGMLGRVATTTTAETGTEMLQGGQEKFATNTALNRQGFDVDPMSGVIANATLEGAAASFMGAAAGIPKPAVATAPGIDHAKEAADTIRATETVPESGPMTRASNAATEAKAQAVEAGAPLVDEQATAEPMPEPVDDPVRDQILALPDGARQNALRAYAVVNRTDVAKGVQQYNRKLLDRLLTENAPPPVLGESLTGTDMGTMLGGGGMAGNTDPLMGALGMGREAQANSITNVANVAERRPPMPASDAARMLDEAPAQTDPVAERLARAAAQGAAVPAPTDILNPVGLPFKTRMAADRAAKQTPGAVVPVEGGFVVRPQEPVNVKDVPQAPEVPQAAPAISPPSQAPQAVGTQPAGPAAGVPTEGAGAVEAAGLTENKVGRKDSAQIAQPESVVGDTSSPWASMTPDQRRRTRLEQEIATGMTNNGGVMVKLRPSAIEKRKQELAAMPPKEAAGVDRRAQNAQRAAQNPTVAPASQAQQAAPVAEQAAPKPDSTVTTMRSLAQQFRDRHAVTKKDTDRTFAGVLDQFAQDVEQGKRTPQSVQQAIERYQELAAEPFQATQTAPATHADPGQAPQAVGTQPAGPAAGVPAEGAGAVEAAGLNRPKSTRKAAEFDARKAAEIEAGALGAQEAEAAGVPTQVTWLAHRKWVYSQAPRMTLREFQVALKGRHGMSGPEIEAYYKSSNGGAEVSAAKITTEGTANVPQADQAQQTATQATQAGAAQPTQGLTDAAADQNTGAQGAPAAGAQAQAPGNASWAALTPEQRRRARLEHEIATGQTNNGGVVAGLRPSAIEKRKQELAAMGDAGKLPSPGPAEPLSADGLAAQGQAAPGAQAAQAGVAPRPKNWRASMLGATPVAKAMGIDTKGKRLAQVVAEIDARDTQAPATPEPAPAPGPTRLGRDNTPLSEGGKPFKTRKAAGDAKKLQPMMRVVTVPGGYALAEKTPAQLAAEERAAKRLRTPRTSPAGEPVPAHAFIAASGGLHMRHRNDLGVDGNPRIGNRRLFGGLNRGLSIEQATEMLVADGYLSEGASHNDAYALIKKSLSQPQYNADGIERIAQAESDAQFEDYMAAQEEAAADGDTDPFGMADEFTAEELDEVGYTAADPALQAEVSALIAQAEAMDIDTYAILEDIARTYANATQDQYNAAARDALAQAIARSNQDGGSVAAQAAPAAEPAAEQGLNRTSALTSKAQAATESVAQTVSTTVEMPPTRQQESSPFARFATGRYRIAIRDEGNGQYAEVVAIQRGSGVEIEMRMPGEALEHPAFSQLNARAQALFETPTASMFDAEPPALELAAQTPAEAAARQDAQEQADKAEAAAKRAEDAAAKAEEERKRIAQASVRAADSFELGQDPMDSLTGQGGLAFSFAGARAATADRHALVTAQDRLSAGEDAETVRRETGWHRGADGRMRFEISDNEATVDMALLANLHRGGFAERAIEHVSYRHEPDGTYSLTLAPKNPQKTSDFVRMRSIPANLLPSLLPQSALDAIERNEGDEDFIGPNLDDARKVRAPFEFTGFNALPLDAVMDHPKLFAAYPALREIMVRVDPKLGNGATFAVTDYVDGTVGKAIKVGNPLAKDVDSVLLHEIQHGIQDIEGFATGGSIESARAMQADAQSNAFNQAQGAWYESRKRWPSAYKSLMDQRMLDGRLYDKYDIKTMDEDGHQRKAIVLAFELRKKISEADKALRSQAQLAYTDAVESELGGFGSDAFNEFNGLYSAVTKAFEGTAETATSVYKRLAGEVEARNTQARKNISDLGRKLIPPSKTADVADSDVIVVFNGKEMQNAPAPVNAEQSLAYAKQQLGTPVDPYQHKLQAIQAARKQTANVVQADNGQWLLAPKAEPYTAQEARDAQQRIDKLNRALGKYSSVAPAAVLPDAPTAAMAWGRSVARTIGYDVTFIQPNPDFHGVAVGGDAFVSASAEHPEIGLIGHEVLHSFKQSDPDTYEALAERIRPYLKNGVVDAKRKWEDARGGQNTSMAMAEEEVFADLNGAMWLDPKFWREMASNDPSLFRQVAYKFMEVATKAMKGLSRFKADALVTDVDAVRKIIAQEWATQAQEMGNPSEFSETDGPAFSRTESIKTAYEARIDALFKGEKAKAGTRILDSSDIMGLLGYPKVPLILNESHLRDGLTNHPEMTASAWKKVPEWIENPAAAYTDARHPTRLTVIAPETLAGYPVMMVIESKPNPAGSKPAPAVAAESLLVTVYAKTTGGLPPASYLASSGAMKYADTKNAPEIWQRGGGQFPKQAALSQGRHKILSEKHLAGYRRGQAKDSAAVDESPPTMFSRTTAASIASSMGELTPDQEQAYKNVAGMKAVPTVRERMDALKANLGLKLRQGLVDQFAAIKQLDQNAYVQARMSKGTDGTLEAMLMYGKPFMRDGAPDVDVKDGGFAKVLASLKGEQDRWMMWIAAQRAEKLKADGKENLMTDDDISALKTLNAGKMADGTGRAPIYARALQELNDYNDAMLKLAMDSGLIDQAAYDLMAGQPYVPFYRLMEDGDMKGPKFSSGLTNQKAWQKLKGGTQQLNADLLQNMLLNWSHLLQASAKNRAATATMDAAEKMAVAYKVDADTKGSVKVMRDGSAEHWMVEDPYLLDAISAIHYVPSPLMKPLAKFKQLLTWGVTANPTFKIRNLIRDSVSAIAQSELGYNPAANVAKGWKLTAKDSQIYASMLASGGLIKFGTQENTDRLRAQVAKLGGVVLDKSGAERFFGQIKDLYDVYNEFGDRAENVNRAALYDALIKKGKTHAEAAFMARDLMDFSMGGSAPVVRFLTQTVPFLNARLVGLDKLGRAAIEDPRRFAAVTGAIALASLALMAAYSDDDDWKKREDWDRDAYWWFKIGGQAYRIPKPFEVGAIGTLAERTAELMFNDEMTGKRYMERVSHMLSGTFSFNPVPQAFKPLLDLYANKDSFTGRAIESQSDQRLRPQDRYSERTPEVAKFLGGLGLPDPAQLVKGEYSALSPKQVEHLVRGYFSWVGTAAMTVSDFGLRPLADRGERPDMRLKDVFIAGNFVENLPTGSSRYVTQMYEQSRQVEQAYASYQEAIKGGDTEKAESIKESAAPLLRNRPAYTAATRQLAEINRTAKRIEADRDMAGAAKRARLTELENRRHVIAQRLSRMAATP